MSTVYKIDGFGTRESDSASSQLANLPERKKVVSLYVYAHTGGGSVTIAKGDALALEYRTAKTATYNGAATSVVSAFGFGNVAVPLITTDELEDFPCGVAAEGITLADAEYALIRVQVYGEVNANVASGTAAGVSLFAGATAGRLAATAADIDEQTKIAVNLGAAASGNKADIFLLNPFNL